MGKLRWRLVGIVFSSVVAVFAIMNLLLIFCLRTYNNDQADQMTQIIRENDGTVPQLEDFDKKSVKKQIFGGNYIEFNEESAFRTRYFCVTVNSDKQILSVDMDHIAAVDEKKRSV